MYSIEEGPRLDPGCLTLPNYRLFLDVPGTESPYYTFSPNGTPLRSLIVFSLWSIVNL